MLIRVQGISVLRSVPVAVYKSNLNSHFSIVATKILGTMVTTKHRLYTISIELYLQMCIPFRLVILDCLAM